MSALNRYKIIKNKHNNYLLIFTTKKGYTSFGIDKLILETINFKNNFKLIEKLGIDYILISNVEIIKKYNHTNSQYNRYCYLAAIKTILKKIIG